MLDLIRVCTRAARAGGEILKSFEEPLRVREKGPADLVTAADLASQEAIRKVILEAFPDHGFVGEEGDSHQRPDQEYCWIVDPLDGTANFVHGLPNYAVSVAVEKGGRILAGAVYDPSLDECFTATHGGGAEVNGRAIRASEITDVKDAMLAVSLPPKVTPDSQDLQDLVEITQHCQSIRRMGSAALNLCYVAAGRVDGYWASVIYPWDVAAGVLAVNEAGGVVTGRDGGVFNLWKPAFLAAANQPLHQRLAGYLIH